MPNHLTRPPPTVRTVEDDVLLLRGQAGCFFMVRKAQTFAPTRDVNAARNPLQGTQGARFISRALDHLAVHLSPATFPVGEQIADPEVDVLFKMHQVVEALGPL